MSTQLKSDLAKQIEREIEQYFSRQVSISDSYDFNQSKLVNRISLFENHIYPTGKFDSQGNYKYWYDIITPRVDAEVKNIDFDTKDVQAYSTRKSDLLLNLITNLKLREWMRTTGQGEEINTAIEQGSGWGNVVWKKVRGSYERLDLNNFYVINQTAQYLTQSPAIERHQLGQSDLRAMEGTWEYIDEVIKECKSDSFAKNPENQGIDTTVPYYEIYERNGEVCLADLKKEWGQEPAKGDEDKYVLAKVVGAGVKGEAQGSSVEIKYILFAEKISKLPYKEYHRGRYKGRWMREGLIELLFDLQVRANQIGNQIAQGLELASKTILQTDDKLIVQNILTDLKNGDIIRAKNLQHVALRMDGFDQLAADWNRVIELANDIANSREVVMGEAGPSGTPFRTTGLLNQNANKLFDFIREKLAIPLSEIFEEWIVPDLIKDLKAQEILRLTGDSEVLNKLYEVIAMDWYLNNLLEIGPHTTEMGKVLRAEKIEELKSRPELLMKGLNKVWDDYKPSVAVDITGEGLNLDVEVQTISSLIALELDPVRRTAMIEDIAHRKGYDYSGLPKTEQQPTQPQPNQPMQPTQKEQKVAGVA